jgi:(2Fe-2S) ferredoxin
VERTLLVCGTFRMNLTTPSCAAGGGLQLMDALRSELLARGLGWTVARSVCLGHCTIGPNLKARGGPLLHGCRPETAAAIIDRLLVEWPVEEEPAEVAADACDWPPPGS